VGYDEARAALTSAAAALPPAARALTGISRPR